MAKYVIDSTTLAAIGDAIRAKDGSTGSILVSNLASKIAAIDTQENLDAELSTQDTLIANITNALASKSDFPNAEGVRF